MSETETTPVLLPTPEGGPSEGRISSVRRTFCLFVLFDLILIFILWVIYTQLFGETGFKAFEDQVKNYSLKYSLFDIVMLSGVRFTLLILAYALLHIRHWWMVAISTAVSCAFLITKIFFFDFEDPKNKNDPLSYCLIIISFVLSWLETWFLDFKVLPHESKLRERNIASQSSRVSAYGSTFIGPRVHFPPGDDIQSMITEDNQYYSPMDTPEGSDTEQEGHPSNRSTLGHENDYVSLGKHSSEVLWSYFKSPESDWKKESGTDESSGIIHSKKIKGVGKVYRLKSVIDIPPKDLFDEMTFSPENHPSWNSALKFCQVLHVISDHTDIVYNISGEFAGGVVKSRDFVSLRCWGCRDGVYMVSNMAVHHPKMPPQKDYVRGTNGAGGWVYKPMPDDERQTLFFWFMNTDIKGWFPKTLIDSNMVKVIEDFNKELQAHVRTITSS